LFGPISCFESIIRGKSICYTGAKLTGSRVSRRLLFFELSDGCYIESEERGKIHVPDEEQAA
jgi:hypothetical protein